ALLGERPRSGPGQRPHPRDAHRARRRDEAAARFPAGRGSRHRHMTSLYLLEPDTPGAEWAPFAGVRPIAELRAGAWRIRERWEAACDTEAAAILGDHVDGFHEGDEAPVRPVETIEGPAVIGASWFAPTGDRIPG